MTGVGEPLWRPAVPPPGHVVVPPRRRRGRGRALALLGWIGFALGALWCVLLVLLVISDETGPAGALVGGTAALVPVVPVVGLYVWLDRREAEPPGVLLAVFVWGAGVATFGSLVINTASTLAIQSSGGDPSWGAVLVAPVVEEAFKGVAVLLVLLIRRRDFDGVVDGLVYAGMAGIGFAFVENVLYLGRALASDGTAGLILLFVIRCVVSPFAHPLFTSATGVGLAIAARTRSTAVRVLAPTLGYVVAVMLHGGWNLSATLGGTLGDFVGTYVLVQVPIFLAFAALAVWARHREGRLIATHLAPYATVGWLSPREVAMLSSIRARREARRWAHRTGGPASRRAMREFQESASELAFLRDRMMRGVADDDPGVEELRLLSRIAQQRGIFLGPTIPQLPPGIR